MNMVRSMLSEKSVPKEFWPEAVRWSVYVLNRSPTFVVKNCTPEEAWSGIKPSVSHFRTFGCVAFAHVPSVHRSKLDDKSIKCILLGLSEESKAYKLYNPITRKIVISRDVKFMETEKWQWQDSNGSNNNEPVGTVIEETEHTPPDGGNAEVETAPVAETDEEQDTTHDSNAEDTEAGSGSDDLEQEATTENNGKRIRGPPVWMKDYNTTFEVTFDEGEMSLAVCSGEDPSNYEDASQLQIWQQAMDTEIKAIEKNNTWKLVDLPKNATPIGVKWVYKTKLNESGKIEKYKARLVAKGYSQRQGIDYNEVFVPVARWDTIRTILAVASINKWTIFQLDVKSAFLHGELNEEVYINQPAGYVKKGEEDKVYKLNKALYGLKQAPRTWYSRIESYFNKEGFTKCTHEHTLFVKTGNNGDILIVSLYVDDLIYTGNNIEMCKAFKESMEKEFEMSDLGKMKYFLGVEVCQTDQGIFINQQKYAKEVLERFGMTNCKGVTNPMVPGSKLSKDEDGQTVNVTTYKQMIGSLMYLTATRPDLMYSVCLCSRFMERPTEVHLIAVKRILRYIRSTVELGIWYKNSNVSRGNNGQLNGYSDSDYAGDVDDRKSTSGYAFMIGTGAVSWASKKQPVVTLSTTEAEFISAAACACQGVWLRRILDSIGMKQDNPTVIYCDNSSTIKLSKNPVLHGRSKHIDVRFHFLRDLSRDEVIKLKYCSTQDQSADILTKPLKLEAFQKLRQKLGVTTMMK